MVIVLLYSDESHSVWLNVSSDPLWIIWLEWNESSLHCLIASLGCHFCSNVSLTGRQGKKDQRLSSNSGPMLYHGLSATSYWSQSRSFISNRPVTGVPLSSCRWRPALRGWYCVSVVVGIQIVGVQMTPYFRYVHEWVQMSACNILFSLNDQSTLTTVQLLIWTYPNMNCYIHAISTWSHDVMQYHITLVQKGECECATVLNPSILCHTVHV